MFFNCKDCIKKKTFVEIITLIHSKSPWATNEIKKQNLYHSLVLQRFLRCHVKAACPTVSLRFPFRKVCRQQQASPSTEATRHPTVWERNLSPVLPVSLIVLLFPTAQPLQWREKVHIQPCLQRSFSSPFKSWTNLWLFRNQEQRISFPGLGANIFHSNLRHTSPHRHFVQVSPAKYVFIEMCIYITEKIHSAFKSSLGRGNRNNWQQTLQRLLTPALHLAASSLYSLEL